MIIVRGLHNFKARQDNLCLTMGNFDGLHLGHQKIIRIMTEKASRIGGKCALFTFIPHPRWVLIPDSPTFLLTTLHEQVEFLSEWHLDILILARFNQNLANMEPEYFVKEVLLKRLMVKEIFVGEGFTFGYKKAGTIEILERLGKRYGFFVNCVDLMRMDGEIISSTLIRNKIQTGRIEEANRLLGHEYSITGKVIKGTGRGWQIGYPTANLKVVSKLLPPKGVYLVKVNQQGKVFSGIANLGYKPTFEKDGAIGVEVYILDMNEDLYGKKLTMYFKKWIREEIAFSTPQDLINQIKVDIQKVNQWITTHPAN